MAAAWAWAGTGGPYSGPISGLCRGPGGPCRGAGALGGAGPLPAAGSVAENMKDNLKRYSHILKLLDMSGVHDYQYVCSLRNLL